MTDMKSAEDLKPGNVPALVKGQKSAMNLQLYGGRVMPQTFGEVVEYAQMMCKGGLAIPKHLRNEPGICLSVIQRSMAWEMDPWAVATKTYAVNDILAYEAQLIAAVVMKWAPIRERVIPYKYEGEGDEMSCSITLHHAETGEEIYYQSPKIKDISPRNSPLWKSDKRQQLGYYTVRALARRFFPDILLGVYDREEAYAMKDITPAKEVENFLNEDETDPPAHASGTTKVNDTPHDAETGEIVEEVITSEKMAENMVKAINGCTDKVHLEEWQNISNGDINALPPDLRKVVKKALDDKHLELLPL